MPDITPENMSFWQSKNPIRWVTTSKDSSDHNVVTLHVGEQGNNVAYAMNSAIADYAANGCNVIVDYIAHQKEWFDDFKISSNLFRHIILPLIFRSTSLCGAKQPERHLLLDMLVAIRPMFIGTGTMT